jgi:tagatose-6-phosphate ketose/aldose isomerase
MNTAIDPQEPAVTSPESVLHEMLRASKADQRELGYSDTLAEICQQPDTWIRTAQAVEARHAELRASVAGCQAIVLTGSGSSQFAAECVHPLLQSALGQPALTVGSGEILLQGRGALPRGQICLVSLARSGDSPESVGVVQMLLDTAPEIRHLVVTCNAKGKLAQLAAGDARVRAIVLDEHTNDRSLVMTSSLTNMVIAGTALAAQPSYLKDVNALASSARTLLHGYADRLKTIAEGPFRNVVYIGSGCRYGAAREAALKMLEMTDGGVVTFAENCLSLRHGPMCAIDNATLVVCFLSSDPLRRAYERDLLNELSRKQIGWHRVITGINIPNDLLAEGDVGIELTQAAECGDNGLAVLDVVAGQLLGFFRSLHEGLKPDAPSASGVISRVVNEFTIHRRKGAEPNR